MSGDITVIIPSIPPRRRLLDRALASVTAQTLPAADVRVEVDHDHTGAPATRDRALDLVTTPLVAPLDDDDELLPWHLERLADHLDKTGADLVYPWFEVVAGDDPFPEWFGEPWDPTRPHQIPVTWLARTGVIRLLGGFSYQWDASQGDDPGVDPDGHRAGEDYRLILRAIDADVKIVHLPERTWRWHHDSRNTMGLPGRW